MFSPQHAQLGKRARRSHCTCRRGRPPPPVDASDHHTRTSLSVDVYMSLRVLHVSFFFLYINRIVVHLPHFSPQGAASVLQTPGGACFSRLSWEHTKPSPAQSRLALSLRQGTAEAHFPTGALTGIKNIYTCVLMIYHTTLVKAISKARKPLPLLFESVLTDASVREYGTGKSSGPVRVWSNRKVAHNHKVIYRFIITQYKAK